MKGDPATMNVDPRYEDVAAEVHVFLTRQMAAAMAAGVARDTIAIDPGFGFGKTPAHNSELLERLGQFKALGRPVLVGSSGLGGALALPRNVGFAGGLAKQVAVTNETQPMLFP